MTPREKAKELVGMFAKKSNNLKQRTDWNYDKQCALIAVDEILNNVIFFWYAPTEDMPKDIVYFVTQKKYWEKVKQEIELL